MWYEISIMTKTDEELKQLKQEYEELNEKLRELTQEELKLVTGGEDNSFGMYTGGDIYIG